MRPYRVLAAKPNLDRYFARQEHLDAARTHECPSCGAAPHAHCLDRWGLPTSLVHQARHQDGYVDAYAMEAYGK